MASKQVIDRQKMARLVLATGETHAGPISAQLGSELSPHLARGEKMPDLALLAQLMLRWLGAAEGALVATDLAHERELSDDAAPRKARDEAAATVRDQLIELRDLVSVLYGSATVTALGMTGETPTDAVALSRQAAAVLSGLASVKLPKPRRKGAELSAKEIDAELRPALTTLDQALTAVSRETREAEVSLSARDQAAAEYDRRFGATTAVLSALLSAAGEAALADKLRPAAGRKRHDDIPPEPPPTPTHT